MGARLRRFARLPSRILAVSAATFLGAVGAVAFAAAPASAHHVTLTGEAVCGPEAGTAVVTWKVTNSRTDKVGTIKRTTREIKGLEDDTTVPARSSLTATETVKLSEGSVSFGLRMTWQGGVREDVDPPVKVDLGKLDCEPAKEPTVTATSNCDGTLTVVIKNTSAEAKRFTVNGEGKFAERKNLKVDEEWTVVVPKANAGKAVVKWKKADDPGDDGWEDDVKFNWAQPEACFDVTAKSTCEDLTINVANTGAKAIKASVTVGEESKQVEIEPGKSAEITLDAVDGLVAKLAVTGDYAKDFAWAKPSDCSGGGLPVTGANAGLLAGAALVLVAGGGGLFLLARRRRIRFAA